MDSALVRRRSCDSLPRDEGSVSFGQTLKGGFAIQFDRKGRWIGEPYAKFPLNHFTTDTDAKADIGFDLTFWY